MKKLYPATFVISVLSVLLLSWGSSGHQKINGSAVLSFNQSMAQFQTWSAMLIQHASDADARKASDPTEGPKHYIDIDNYNDFLLHGAIVQNFDSALVVYGSATLYDNGILPWATLVCYDSLKSCFQRQDWSKAVLFAADLGHYVADGHMPLHITRNYDGQFTGNSGIHSRYESTMINAYVGQISYSGDNIQQVADIDQYVFDYLYANFVYVDSVIAADNYAKGLSSNTSSSVYKQALWEKTSGFTTHLFKNASNALAELMYNAWLEAGSPVITSASINDFDEISAGLKLLSYTDPDSGITHIDFTMPHSSHAGMRIFDSSGRLVITLIDGEVEAGGHSITWDNREQRGIYFVVLQAAGLREVKKVLLH